MRGVEPWKSQSEAEFDNALEAMEKLVMNRLYPYTFTPQISPTTPITTDDLERDAVFAQRVRLFGWVREGHLDVPDSEAAAGFLGFAEQGWFSTHFLHTLSPHTVHNQLLGASS